MTLLESPVARHFSKYGELDREQLELIAGAAFKSTKTVGARRDIILEGARPGTVKIVLEGWAARYKELPDGHRQLLSIMIPGDICDANAFIIERMDHSLGTLTEVTYGEISRTDFETLLTSSPEMTRALWWSELVNASIQREWTANIGQRQAGARIAHLFCEMHVRLSGIGQCRENSIEFPLTQADIGEATGLTPVHVNRTLQNLRKNGLIELRDRRLTIPDPAELRRLAQFDPAYLHTDVQKDEAIAAFYGPE